MSIPTTSTFTSPKSFAMWTKTMLVITLLLSLVAIASGIAQTTLLYRAEADNITDSEAAANDSREQLIGILQLVVLIGTAVAFLAWLYRVRENLGALGGRGFKYDSLWVVFGFIVPFLNLVRPPQVMREVWHGSDPARLESDLGQVGPELRNQLGTPPQIAWWWTLFILFSILGRFASRLASSGQTIESLQFATVLFILSDILSIAAALMAVSLVERITAWQSERRARIAQGGAGTMQAFTLPPDPGRLL